MSLSGVQTEAKPPVLSPQASLVLIYRSTEGMKVWVEGRTCPANTSQRNSYGHARGRFCRVADSKLGHTEDAGVIVGVWKFKERHVSSGVVFVI
ncbi:hypothetical protein TNCV_2381951 [Trichonephila clavipes]|nr:hypothetical protein TNCV_2381951 [Trichonephila clavipes]